MTNKELAKWLRENSSGIYRPCCIAADRLERMEFALRQLAECHLTEENCASLEVANKRVRNIANNALK
jgi:hypothetical protein